MWVYDLIPKSAGRKVGPLRNIKEFIDGGTVESATTDWPEPTEDSEERRLTAAVRSADDAIHSRRDLEIDFLDEHIAIGRDDRNSVEFDDILSLDNLWEIVVSFFLTVPLSKEMIDYFSSLTTCGSFLPLDSPASVITWTRL